MRDSSNVFVLFIVAFVAVIAVVVMLVSPSVNYHFFDSVGFAFSSLYSGYAVPIGGIIVDNNISFAGSTDTIQKSLDVSDDIVYRRAYISYDGSSWTPFNLTPSGIGILNGNWIYGRGISNIVFSPSMLHLNSSRTSSNNTYIIIYSCSKNTTIHNWSCHDGWQIIPFNAKLNSGSSLSSIVIYAAGSYGDGSYPTMQLSINNVVVASWVVGGNASVPFYVVYNFTYSGVIDNTTIVRVIYPNDIWGSPRDLRVDKIVIDNVTYESESPSNINTGLSDGTRCGGYDSPGNEWLVCSGYIQYNLSSTSSPPPSCTPACSNKQCGGDGCSGTCGNCLLTQTCNLNGVCVNNVVSPFCGDGNCTGNESCSNCLGDCGTCQSYKRTFYVSSSTGNDNTGDGSINNPWQTLSKVNSHSFLPGDGILFKRGDTWYGTLIVSSSGSSTAPITYGAYGSGDKPIITGFTTITGWTNYGSGIYSKAVSAASVPSNMVTVDGVNTGKGQYPKAGNWLYNTAVGTGYITDNSLPSSPNWAGAQIFMKTEGYRCNHGTITSQATHQINYNRQDGWAGGDGHNGWGYFIDNDLRTLTTINGIAPQLGEWFHDGTTFYMYFGSVNSTTKVVKVATLDNAVICAQSYINIDSISFIGFNGDHTSSTGGALYLDAANYVSITNCEIGFIGASAILVGTHLTIDNCWIHDTNGEAFLGSHNYFTLTNSTIENVGLIYSLMGSWYARGLATNLMTAQNVLVQYNIFRHIGSVAAYFCGSNVKIDKNLFDDYCNKSLDCGAIYMNNAGGNSNRVISNNIILNSTGSVDGTTESIGGVEGIYLDEPTSGVTVSGNTVENMVHGSGIKLHEAHDIIISNNTLYNNLQGYQFLGSGAQPNDPIRNVTMSNNKIIAASAGQVLWYFWASAFNDIPQFGTANGQYYARPIDDGVDQDFWTSESNWGYRTYAYWLSRSGETDSTFSSVTASSLNDILFEYNAAETNKVITLNGNYRDVKGTAYSGSVTLAPYTSIVLIKN